MNETGNQKKSNYKRYVETMTKTKLAATLSALPCHECPVTKAFCKKRGKKRREICEETITNWLNEEK